MNNMFNLKVVILKMMSSNNMKNNFLKKMKNLNNHKLNKEIFYHLSMTSPRNISLRKKDQKNKKE